MSGLEQSNLPAAKALDLIGRSEPPMACCPECAAPLIRTLVFRHYEFYCLECGRKWGFLDPHPQTSTAELEARYSTLDREWKEHAGARLIVEGRSGSPAAQAEQDAAIAWLADRAARSRD